MESQINSISQLPLEIKYNNINAILTFNKYRGHKVTISYFQRPKILHYLLHETDAFYVVGKTKEEAIIKMYNLLKEKNVIWKI